MYIFFGLNVKIEKIKIDNTSHNWCVLSTSWPTPKKAVLVGFIRHSWYTYTQQVSVGSLRLVALNCNTLLCREVTAGITTISTSFSPPRLTKGLLMLWMGIKTEVQPLGPGCVPTYWGNPTYSIKAIYVAPWRKLAHGSQLFHVRHTVEALLR